MNANKVQLLNIELEKHSFSVWKAIIITVGLIIFGILSFKLYSCLKLKFVGGGNDSTQENQALTVVFTDRDVEECSQEASTSTVSNINTLTKTRPLRILKIIGEARF